MGIQILDKKYLYNRGVDLHIVLYTMSNIFLILQQVSIKFLNKWEISEAPFFIIIFHTIGFRLLADDTTCSCN